MRRFSRLLAPSTLAVVDMGSNSFRLELGRVEGDQIFRLDTWRENLRVGAGLDRAGRLSAGTRRAALACLARFGERLRGFSPSAVRAVATNTFRVARNAAEFLPLAEGALGFPIDVISGHEEARLIYIGVAHVLPPSAAPRLVVDIGGGSTEFIIGRGEEPLRLESLAIGCVSLTQRCFADGSLRAERFTAAETQARAEIEAIAGGFARAHWSEAYASSGTALALADILEQNGMSTGGITRAGLLLLRRRMIAAGRVDRLRLTGLKAQRAPVLAGGFSIMLAALDLLDVTRINPVGGALRLGALYDLLGRGAQSDARVATVARFIERYHVDRPHAERVSAMARMLYTEATGAPRQQTADRLAWAGLLHEVGYTVSHTGFHKHGAYILDNADMPGFSSQEQHELALLVLGARGRLAKMTPALQNADFRAALLALRLAVLFHHARRTIGAPRVALIIDKLIRLRVSPPWLAAHPLTAHLLLQERAEWVALGYGWKTGKS